VTLGALGGMGLAALFEAVPGRTTAAVDHLH